MAPAEDALNKPVATRLRYSQGHRCKVCGLAAMVRSRRRTSSVAIGNTARLQPLLQLLLQRRCNFPRRSSGMCSTSVCTAPSTSAPGLTWGEHHQGKPY